MTHDSTITSLLKELEHDRSARGPVERENPIGRRQVDREIRWLIEILDRRQVDQREEIERLRRIVQRNGWTIKLLLAIVLGADLAGVLIK